MKKLLALILAVICCLGMVACGGGEDKEANGKALEDAIAMLNLNYKDMNRTPADYELIASIPVGDKTVSVTWSVNNSAIKVVKNGKMVTIDVPDVNDTEANYVLTATVKLGSQTKTKTFNLVLPVIIFDPYESEPAENTAFKLMLTQGSLGGKNLFATHDMDQGKYYVSTEDVNAAPDFYAEKVEGGYKFYTMIDGVKSYVLAYLEGTSKRLKYDAAEGTVWYYKEDCKAWFTMISGGEYCFGTYGSYVTFCISDGSYMKPDTTGVTQFPANLITKENVAKLEPADEVVIYDTIAEIYDEAAKLADNALLSGGHKYTLTGTITSIDTEYSADYKNVTVTIDVEGKAFQCFRLKGDGADTIKVGDTITVEGPVSAYKGKVQVNQGDLKSVTAA